MRRDTACRVPKILGTKKRYIIQEPFKFEEFGNPSAGSLSTIIRSYKSAVTRNCHKADFNYFAWQKNYFDRIIRNKWELMAFRKYILNNPQTYSTSE